MSILPFILAAFAKGGAPTITGPFVHNPGMNTSVSFASPSEFGAVVGDVIFVHREGNSQPSSATAAYWTALAIPNRKISESSSAGQKVWYRAVTGSNDDLRLTGGSNGYDIVRVFVIKGLTTKVPILAKSAVDLTGSTAPSGTWTPNASSRLLLGVVSSGLYNDDGTYLPTVPPSTTKVGQWDKPGSFAATFTAFIKYSHDGSSLVTTDMLVNYDAGVGAGYYNVNIFEFT